MPIYTYKCGSCDATREYLVNMGARPRECMDCNGKSLERVYAGQTFGLVTGTARISCEGVIENVTARNAASVVDTLEPGIHITTGVTADGGEVMNVSRVTPEGRVDVSVTGKKSPGPIN